MTLELIEDIIVRKTTIGSNFTFILKPESCNKSMKRWTYVTVDKRN